jgi:hypothetical protein
MELPGTILISRRSTAMESKVRLILSEILTHFTLNQNRRPFGYPRSNYYGL